nr:E3 ubiquitin-protein ligase RNF220-like [Salvelinus alpinus]
MDLHRPSFKMDSSSYLPSPLASPALMVLASTAEAGNDSSIPCQAPRPFGVPISEKDLHLPFPSGSYTFASMYHRQGPVSSHGTFPTRDFPASLLHLHPQFHPPNLDCSSLGMLNHSGVGAFRPFSSPPEEREVRGYQSAFTPAKRLKGCYTDSERKQYEFGGGRILSGSPWSLKAAEDSGRKLFAVSGLLSDSEALSSPEDRKEGCGQGGEVAGPPSRLKWCRDTTFLRVRTNRHTRLNVRIGKLKRRKADEVQDILVDLGGEGVQWRERRRLQMTSMLGGFKGSVFVSSSTSNEGRGDSDADLDVDGDDTADYGRAQYTEADIIPCSQREPGEVEERKALRGAVLNVGTLSNRVTLEHSKWTNEGCPSTSNGERNKLDNSIISLHRTCKNSDIETVSEDSALTTLDALKTRIRDLEKQMSRGDRYKCLICMDTYTTPLSSIQCWHVHCEECWLRTLGAKKLCPQCNTITSPGDLRRVYL